MNANLYKVKCITNMHVGSGEVNYNIIDNEVERDPITNIPMIFSSGVKGALRDCLQGNKEIIDNIFGKEGTGEDSRSGCLKFLSANMLFRPMRNSKGNEPYTLVATKEMIQQYNELVKEFKIKGDKLTINYNEAGDDEIEVEGFPVKVFKVKNYSTNQFFQKDKQFGLMEYDNFKQVDLPVLARNKLGENKNLWYEEVVPRESIFYFFVLSDGTNNGNAMLTEFDKMLTNNVGNLVQFGGNATIGYGLTKVTKVGDNYGKN